MISRALMEDYENSRSSPGLAVDCLPRTYLDGGQSALSSWIGTADAFLHSDIMTDTYDPHSRFGMTFVPLTADRGAGVLMSFLEAFRARLTAQPLREKTLLTISGRKCDGSWQMSLPGTYLPRTSQKLPSMPRATTSKRWVTKPAQFPLARMTWVQTTFGSDIGYLHTPTTKANYAASSMQKWPSSRSFVAVFGRPAPSNQEWMMGWPAGWVTEPEIGLSRAEQLKACGNGVVPQQAAAALRELLSRPGVPALDVAA